MPILPSIQHYITSEETEFEAPVAESVAQNIGESINYLNDLFSGNLVEFLVNGNWVVPASVSKILIKAVGGGGGGLGGASSTSGGGGAGAYPKLIQQIVTPGDLLTISIGAGGAGGAIGGGSGGNGGNTTISGTGFTLTFRGAAGATTTSGATGGNSSTNLYGFDFVPGASHGNDSFGASNGIAGGSSLYANGGAGGIGFPGQSGSTGGGGGGGAGLKSGGAGGNGSLASNNTSTAGAAAAANSGAGGGGGGGASLGAKAGGAGGSGHVLISWF